MKHFGLNIAEGSEITNLTAPTGTSFPSLENAGELFYRTDVTTLYVYDGSAWQDLNSGGSSLINFVDTGSPSSAEILYDGTTTVLASTATGVDITGTLTIGAFTIPDTDGTVNQVLSTDGSGTLTWVTPASGVWTSDGSDGAVISGTGDVVVHIEADTDNTNEDDSPMLLMSQDGGTITQHALKIDGSNRFVLENIAVTTTARGIYFQEEADAGGSTFEMAHEGNLTDLDIVQTNTNNTFIGTNTFPNGTVIAGSTGVIDLAGGRYTATWALDMNNSDIRGANGIYYNDEAQSRGEGFNWPLPGVGAYDSIVDTDWMSIRAYQGDLIYWDGIREFTLGEQMWNGTTVIVQTDATGVTINGTLTVLATTGSPLVEYFDVSDTGVVTFGGVAYPSADGTVDQVLSTDGAGTLSWVTPAGASSPVTTKGDLYTYDTGDQRLAVGTNGYVLTADSAEATGLKWAVASGSGLVNFVDIGSPSSGQMLYDGTTIVLESSASGLTVTGTLDVGNVSAATGVNLQYNGTTKLETTTDGATLAGTLIVNDGNINLFDSDSSGNSGTIEWKLNSGAKYYVNNRAGDWDFRHFDGSSSYTEIMIVTTDGLVMGSDGEETGRTIGWETMINATTFHKFQAGAVDVGSNVAGFRFDYVSSPHTTHIETTIYEINSSGDLNWEIGDVTFQNALTVAGTSTFQAVVMEEDPVTATLSKKIYFYDTDSSTNVSRIDIGSDEDGFIMRSYYDLGLIRDLFFVDYLGVFDFFHNTVESMSIGGDVDIHGTSRSLNIASGDIVLGVNGSSGGESGIQFLSDTTNEKTFLGTNNDRFQIRGNATANTNGTLMVNIYNEGSVQLYHNGSQRFVTTAAGATINGTVTIGAFTIPNTDGTVDQVLSTDGSGTLTWVTPGSASSPLTTKGDVYTYDTGDQRLAVGANGLVLTADSAEATGLKWAAASGSGLTNFIDSGSPSIGEMLYDGTTTVLESSAAGVTVTGEVQMTKITASGDSASYPIVFPAEDTAVAYDWEVFADTGFFRVGMRVDGGALNKFMSIGTTGNFNTFDDASAVTMTSAATGVTIYSNNLTIGQNGVAENAIFTMWSDSSNHSFTWFADSTNLTLRNGDETGERHAQFTNNAGVALFYNSNQKMETTINGVNVNGHLTVEDTTTHEDHVINSARLTLPLNWSSAQASSTFRYNLDFNAGTGARCYSITFQHATSQYRSLLWPKSTAPAGQLASTAVFDTQYWDGLRIYDAEIKHWDGTQDHLILEENNDGHWVPQADSAHDLGLTATRFREGFFDDIDTTALLTGDLNATGDAVIGGTLTVGDGTASPGIASIDFISDGLSPTYDAQINVTGGGAGSPPVDGGGTVTFVADMLTLNKGGTDYTAFTQYDLFQGLFFLGQDGTVNAQHRLYSDVAGKYTTIQSNGATLEIRGGSSTGELMATFVDDGAVTLYHNAVSRINTTAAGVNITGELSCDNDLYIGGAAETAQQALWMANDNGGIVWFVDGTSGNYNLFQTSAAGAPEDNIINCTRNGGTTFYYNNNQCMETQPGGLYLGVNAVTNGLVRWQSSTTAKYMEQGMDSLGKMNWTDPNGKYALTLATDTMTMGRSGTAATKHIEFHTYDGATTASYDARISASGGTVDTTGAGTLTVEATTNFQGFIELGIPDTAGYAAIDFHTGGFENDYDIRILGVTGTGTDGTNGEGNLYHYATTHKFFGAMEATGNISTTGKITANPAAAVPLVLQRGDNNSSTYVTYVQFLEEDDTESGTIKVNDTNTQFNTSSDYRLKTEVASVESAYAIETIDALRPVTYKWKKHVEREENPKTVWGFLAHEVQEAYPQAVHGEKDEVFEYEGETIDVHQSMEYGGLTTVSIAGTKAVLEMVRQQQVTIDLLMERIAALENQ